MERFIDIVASLLIGAISLVFYPFVILAIKLDDGGKFSLFRTSRQEQQNNKRQKFRSMFEQNSAEQEQKITRVGKWL